MDDIEVKVLKVKSFKIICEDDIEIGSETNKVWNLFLRKDGYHINGAYGFEFNGSYDADERMTLKLLLSKPFRE